MNARRHPSTTTRVATLSIAANSLLIALKAVAGIPTGSVGVRSDAIHSLMNGDRREDVPRRGDRSREAGRSALLEGQSEVEQWPIERVHRRALAN